MTPKEFACTKLSQTGNVIIKNNAITFTSQALNLSSRNLIHPESEQGNKYEAKLLR